MSAWFSKLVRNWGLLGRRNYDFLLGKVAQVIPRTSNITSTLELFSLLAAVYRLLETSIANEDMFCWRKTCFKITSRIVWVLHALHIIRRRSQESISNPWLSKSHRAGSRHHTKIFSVLVTHLQRTPHLTTIPRLSLHLLSCKLYLNLVFGPFGWPIISSSTRYFAHAAVTLRSV